MAAGARDRRPLPSGVVTFVFTDIEGSTRLAQRLGDRWAEVLALHRAVVREQLAAVECTEVSTEGDSFFVAFADARTALETMAGLQAQLAATAWPTESPVRVRMGAHTGAVEIHDDDYVGVEVHRAARVASSANGGQLLASRSALDAAQGVAGEVTGLGAYHLKDFDEPCELFDVRAVGQPADVAAPLPRANAVGLHHLPHRWTSFVGRGRETAEVADAVGASRLVTLVGPGGTGKTSLAVEATRRLGGNWPDGVWFIDLSAVPAATSIAAACVASLELAPPPDCDLAQFVVAEVAPRRALLVIDNAEHVLDSTADLVSALLASGDSTRVVVTSREALRVNGEVVLSVGTLAPDDAVRLFAERAEAAGAADKLDESAVGAVCELLDRLPLAIEIAAARMGSMTVDDLATTLADVLGTLRGARGGAVRQRSVDALVGWSEGLLDDAQRAMFRRCAALPGGVTVASAGAVCAAAPVDAADVEALLEALTEKSLAFRVVDDDDAARYRQLDLVRAVAGERLDASGERRETMERAFAWVARLGWRDEPHPTADEDATRIRQHRREAPNIRAALHWAVAEGGNPRAALPLIEWFGEALWMRGALDEHEQLATHAVAALGDQATVAERTVANGALLHVARSKGQRHRAQTFAEEVISSHARIDDADPAAPSALAACIDAADWLRDPGLSEELAHRLRTVAAAHGSLPMVLRAREVLAAVAEETGRLEEAEAIYEELIDEAARRGRPEPISRLNLAMCLDQQGRLDEAATAVELAIAELRAAALLQPLTFAHQVAIAVEVRRGDPVRGWAFARDGASLAIDLNDDITALGIFYGFERILRSVEDWERAVAVATARLALHPPDYEDTQDEWLVEARAALGDATYDRAAALLRGVTWQEALATIRAMPAPSSPTASSV
ncbi:MAG: hypothetical protein QOG90_1276 [Actinomycetota bacterium]